MSFNNHQNDGYRSSNKRSAGGGSGKSAYEIRTDVLKLALDLHLANIASKDHGGTVSAEDVVNTANTFNEFISKKSDK